MSVSQSLPANSILNVLNVPYNETSRTPVRLNAGALINANDAGICSGPSSELFSSVVSQKDLEWSASGFLHVAFHFE